MRPLALVKEQTMKRAKPSRILVRATRHYTKYRLEETKPKKSHIRELTPEPSDEAIWTVLEHVPLRGPQLELVLDMLSKIPA